MGVIRDNRTQIVAGGLISASYVSDVYNVLTGNTVENIAFSGSVNITGSLIADLTGTASFANTASYSIVTTNIVTSSSFADTANTASYVLNAVSSSYALSASFAPSGITFNLSDTIFVSPAGNDSTGTVGDISKPYATLIAAKNSAESGSLIYVLPGTWSFDNRDAEGNPYNNNMDTLLNLWKNNVNYYFSPGTKINFYNQTITGNTMALFKPLPSQSGDTVNVYGALEFETISEGADIGNGRAMFFGYLTTFLSSSYEFNCQLKSMKSFSSELILCENGSGTTVPTESINIECDYVYHSYTQGQTGSGSTIFFLGSGTVQNSTYKFKNVEIPSTVLARPITIRSNNSGSIYSINYDYIDSRQLALHCRQPAVNTIINLNVLTGIVGTGIYDADSGVSADAIVNINGNFYSKSSTVTNFIKVPIGQGVVNFNGNVFLENISGNGKALLNNAGSGVCNLNCNVIYSGSNTTTTMITSTNGTTTFSGNIYGSYAGRMVTSRNGRVNIKNSYISSSVDGMTLFNNTVTSTQGTVSLTNSTIFVSSSTDLINGQYLKTNILNSQIKNSGTSNIISNTNTNGSVQLHNSLLITSGSSTINITGAAPLVVSNTTSNTPVTASVSYGTVTELTEADIL